MKTFSSKHTISGLGIFLLVLVGILLRYFWVRPHLPAHYEDIVKTFDAVSFVYAYPQSDHSGGRITYVQTTERGMGVFLLNTVTEEKQLVAEETNHESGDFVFDVGPWSPHDDQFIYTKLDMVGFPPQEEMFICKADGEEVARFPVGTNLVATFSGSRYAWLTDESLAFVDRAGELHLFRQEPGRSWEEAASPGIKAAASSFTALSDTAVAWQKKNQIWSYDVVSNKLDLLLEIKAGNLKGFTYARDKKEMILSCAESGQDSLWRVSLSDGQPLNPSRIAFSLPLNTAYEVNGSQAGYAYLSPQRDNKIVVVHPDPAAKPIKLFNDGNVEGLSVSADGKKLFIVGVVTNEPFAGIWEYDVESAAMRCLVPCSDHPSNYARRPAGMLGSLTMPNGRTVKYRLYPPATFDRHQHMKYPLLIGDTGFPQYGRLDPALPHWGPAATSCGAYLAVVLRADWYGVDTWGEDVTAVYKHLIETPTIDRQRVFLYGWSIETIPLSKLLTENSRPWRGAIMFSPIRFPDLSTMPTYKLAPRILISFGEAEGIGDRVKQFQANAIKSGLMTEVCAHADAVHRLQGNSDLRERTRAVLNFVFNQ